VPLAILAAAATSSTLVSAKPFLPKTLIAAARMSRRRISVRACLRVGGEATKSKLAQGLGSVAGFGEKLSGEGVKGADGSQRGLVGA